MDIHFIRELDYSVFLYKGSNANKKDFGKIINNLKKSLLLEAGNKLLELKKCEIEFKDKPWDDFKMRLEADKMKSHSTAYSIIVNNEKRFIDSEEAYNYLKDLNPYDLEIVIYTKDK